MPKKKRRPFIFLGFIIIMPLICFQYGDILYIPDETATIYLTAIPASIQSAETSKIMVIGEKATGYPLPNNIKVYLFSSAEQIDQEVSFYNDQAESIYQSDQDQCEDGIITARSGHATISPVLLTITFNQKTEPDISYILISAQPMGLPAGRGKSDIQVLALDEEMVPVVNK